jgi:hypothetical protein
MRKLSIICATVGAIALTGLVTAAPAAARSGWGPGFAGGLVGGAIVGGAASSAYDYAPGPGYGVGGYESEYGVRGYGSYGHPYRTFGTYDESQHGGQPSYGRPLGE